MESGLIAIISVLQTKSAAKGIVVILIASHVAMALAVMYQTVKSVKTVLVSGLFQLISVKLMLKTLEMVRFISNMNGTLPQETWLIWMVVSRERK